MHFQIFCQQLTKLGENRTKELRCVDLKAEGNIENIK